MSRKQNNWTRRGTLAGVAAFLAGCSSSEPPEKSSNSSNKSIDNGTEDQEPIEETDNSSEIDDQGDVEEEKEEQEEEPYKAEWTWEDVEEYERDLQDDRAIDTVVNRALDGDEIGPELSRDIDRYPYGYSHGQGHWDKDHFEDLDFSDPEEFMKIVNDALTVGAHVMHHRDGRDASSRATEYGETAETLIEEIHDEANIQIHGWGNGGHGFNYVYSEEHGAFAFDVAWDMKGRAGSYPFSGKRWYDMISAYEDSWIDPQSDDSEIRANGIQNFLTNGMFDSRGGLVNQLAVGYNFDHIPDLVEKYKSEDGGDFLMNKHRPAVATLVYTLQEDIDEEEQILVIDPDSLKDLPDIRDYDVNSAEGMNMYKSDLMELTERMDYDEHDGEIKMNIGSLPSGVVKDDGLSEKVEHRHFQDNAL